MKWWNNGIKNVRAENCPEGYTAGRLPFERTPLSEETKQKISSSNKGHVPWNKGIKTGPEPEHVKEKKRSSALVRDNSIYKGREPWNKGLDSEDERVRKYVEKQKGQLRTGDYVRGEEHPSYNPNREEFLRYRSKVSLLSEKQYVKYKDILNPENHPRTLAGVEGGYQLDHVKSIYQCWSEGISPEEASAVDNLQMLPWIDNLKKGKKDV